MKNCIQFNEMPRKWLKIQEFIEIKKKILNNQEMTKLIDYSLEEEP